MSTNSAVKICNLALGNIGSKAGIDSLEEDSNEAYYCNLFYEVCLESAMREHDWNYARRRRSLVSYGTPPTTEWDYQYVVPSDMLAARYIVNGLSGASLASSNLGIGSVIFDPSVTRPDPPPIPFELALDSTGTKKVILTDQVDAILCYTANITDPAMFDAQFVEALSWKLGSMLAMPIRGDIKTKQAAETMYQNLKTSTFVSSGSEGNPRPQPEAEWIRGRL